MYDRQVDEPRLTAWQRADVANPLPQPFLEDARAALSKRYEHSVPKVASSGPRISLAFRHGVNERKPQTY